MCQACHTLERQGDEITASTLAIVHRLRCIYLMDTEPMALLSVSYEVFGKVQKVFFRKHTAEKAQELGLHGWVMNTPKGTVTGQLEGPVDQVQTMKGWLERTGSPKSVIDKAVFTDEREITTYSFPDFELRR